MSVVTRSASSLLGIAVGVRPNVNSARIAASQSSAIAIATVNIASCSLTAQRHPRLFSSSSTLNRLSRPTVENSPHSPSSISHLRSPPLGANLSPQDILSHFSKAPFPTSNPLGDNAQLATRAMTHESFMYGHDDHNRRLAFLGRRSLKMFTTLFIHSNLSAASSSSPSDFVYLSKLLKSPIAVDEILLTSRIGDTIGRHLALEKVMRWTPAVTEGQLGPKETGLYKIRGVCVEALVGAIYHQAGAEQAQKFYYAHMLPELTKVAFPEQVPEKVRQEAIRLSQEAIESLA